MIGVHVRCRWADDAARQMHASTQLVATQHRRQAVAVHSALSDGARIANCTNQPDCTVLLELAKLLLLAYNLRDNLVVSIASRAMIQGPYVARCQRAGTC